MTESKRERLGAAELEEFFDRLFPDGIAGPDVLDEIAPGGWESSPLLACFHPSAEQVYREVTRMHRNVEDLIASRNRKSGRKCSPPEPEPTFDEILAEWKETPIEPAKEAADLVGMCLWDIFSDNHEVTAEDGRVADAGSFRSSAGFIDGWISGRAGFASKGNYLRFYLGTIWLRARANLIPVYAMIFRRLKAQRAEWHYRFPQLYVVDLGAIGNADEPQDEREAEQRRQRQREVDELRAALAESNREARQDARVEPPPDTVRAYEMVYGRWPSGWPPEVE